MASCCGFPAAVVSSARRALRNIQAAATERDALRSAEAAARRGKGGRKENKERKQERGRGGERRKARRRKSKKEERKEEHAEAEAEAEEALLLAAAEASAFLDEMRAMREPLRGMSDAVASSVVGAFAAKARLVAERAGQGVLAPRS